MWTYAQSTGDLTGSDGSLAGVGYSGRGTGLDNPSAQATVDIGPIPAGRWIIGPFFDDPGGKGPIVAHLTPVTGTETFGRSGFMIHGDNAALTHTASEGCVILAHSLRQMMMSGLIPISRSLPTLCWVGLVLSSSAALM